MADNTFVNIGGHKVSAGKKYSTSEVKTGDVWIDGKPIYRMVFTGNLPSTINANTETSIAIGTPTNWDTVVRIYGSQKLAGYPGVPIPLDKTYIDTRDCCLYVFVASYIYYRVENVRIGSDLASQQYNIVIEYTKTTD